MLTTYKPNQSKSLINEKPKANKIAPRPPNLPHSILRLGKPDQEHMGICPLTQIDNDLKDLHPEILYPEH